MKGFICKTPKAFCNGSAIKKVNAGLRATLMNHHKIHSTQKEIMNCYTAYLSKNGYKRVGQRMFQKEGEPILIVDKLSRIGLPLRKGKEDRLQAIKHSGGIF